MFCLWWLSLQLVWLCGKIVFLYEIYKTSCWRGVRPVGCTLYSFCRFRTKILFFWSAKFTIDWFVIYLDLIVENMIALVTCHFKDIFMIGLIDWLLIDYYCAESHNCRWNSGIIHVLLFNDWLVDWIIKGLMDYWLIDWLIDWSIDRLIDLFYRWSIV